MHQIVLFIKGMASGKSLQIKVPNYLKNSSLMSFLRSQNIPIASSCYGEGICKKCKINENILSCQITVDEFSKLKQDVSIDYF